MNTKPNLHSCVLNLSVFALAACGSVLLAGCGGGTDPLAPKPNENHAAPSSSTGSVNANTNATTNTGTPGGNAAANSNASVPGSVTATAQEVRSLDVQWTNDPSFNTTSVHVYTGTTLVATLPSTATAYHISNLAPDQNYTVRVAAVNSKGESTGSSATATTLHSQPAAWTTCEINAFSNKGDGAAGTYWMRSSSMDNASMVFSSPLKLAHATGDIKNGDSFYVGSRQQWDMWVLETTHFAAGKMEDAETFTYNQVGSARIRLYNPDGSTKKYITSGRAVLIIRYASGQYLMSAQYQPTTADADLPAGTWLCQDVPLTATKIAVTYK